MNIYIYMMDIYIYIYVYIFIYIYVRGVIKWYLTTWYIFRVEVCLVESLIASATIRSAFRDYCLA